MYINGLGMRNIGQLQTTVNSSQKTANVSSFDDRMQKAVETWKTMLKTGDDSDSSNTNSNGDYCCDQCYMNSKIINQMLMRSLYSQSLSGSMLGLPSYGSRNSVLSAYGNTLGLLGGSIFGNIQL
ncbi:MAG: hypothetical protein K2N85_13740 [Lachnospiraceae bacterium]|nr:hypothetical protein [Lachnospiraceae bacterium]